MMFTINTTERDFSLMLHLCIIFGVFAIIILLFSYLLMNLKLCLIGAVIGITALTIFAWLNFKGAFDESSVDLRW